VNFKAFTEHRFFRPGLGAALTVLCGLALWKMPLGERWVNASYDYLFLFGARPVTNKVVLVLMDNEAYDYYHAERGLHGWDRGWHTELLNKLADDDCPLVVLDIFFETPGDEAKDKALADAMQRLNCVVLMAEQKDASHPEVVSAGPTEPTEPFLSAARTNWGVPFFDADLDSIVRKHWPFPAPGDTYDSLSWTAARLAGAKLSRAPQEQWLRYYGAKGPWTPLSYHFALGKSSNYFSDKIVFVGNKPKTTAAADKEEDKFCTPYTRLNTRLNKIAVGGVELNAIAFLNLLNGDWLRRPSWWIEASVLLAAGVMLGAGLARVGRLKGCALAAGAGFATTAGAFWLSQLTNYWFPWLVIVGGQMPCALAWALLAPKVRAPPQAVSKTAVVPWTPRQSAALLAEAIHAEGLPDTPDYELVDPPFGQGGFGKVWLARNAIGQWQALKAVYRANFKNEEGPFEAEFKGIKRYKPISDKHPGLLRVDFVSRKKSDGYFYYVMELGDAQTPGWQDSPRSYKPRDLSSVRARAEGRRLPVLDCVRIGLSLAEALDFLHRQGLTHRDIKPSNVIFVDGRPKLADMGLVTELHPPDQVTSYGGTPGYMPPAPEPPGTAQADIYALGMLLYVISTGREPTFFPELSTTLVDNTQQVGFVRLNTIILRACYPDCAERYKSAAELRDALQATLGTLETSAATGRA
jgi:CHASE2 domain-containing sensor protein